MFVVFAIIPVIDFAIVGFFAGVLTGSGRQFLEIRLDDIRMMSRRCIVEINMN